MKILMVLTSHDRLGDTGRKTGFWLEEFAAPYFVFRDAGVELTLASPKGGQPPIDPKSDLPENQTPAMARFKQDAEAQKMLSQTVKLSDMKSEDFDTIFYVGGHGPMWDLADNPDSIALIESLYHSGNLWLALAIGMYVSMVCFDWVDQFPTGRRAGRHHPFHAMRASPPDRAVAAHHSARSVSAGAGVADAPKLAYGLSCRQSRRV